jgi:hypothetical protein
LPKYRFEKLFSAEEANQLIPRLEFLVRRLQMQANSLRARIREIAGRDSSILGLELADVVGRHPELRPFAAAMAEAAGAIESLGCLLKDIDQGLVDFPGEIGEQVVFLCWQFGEPHIVAWHALDSGFAERKPLPGAAKLYLN